MRQNLLIQFISAMLNTGYNEAHFVHGPFDGKILGLVGADLHTVKEDVAVLKSAARSHTDPIKANTEAIRAVQTDLKNINHRFEVVEVKLAS